MVRSPHAHARHPLDRHGDGAGGARRARRAHRPRLLADGMKPIPHRRSRWHPAEIPLINTDGSAAVHARRISRLPIDKARFVGEAVAMVIAETRRRGEGRRRAGRRRLRGAARVTRDRRRREARTRRACTTTARSNVCLDAEVGDAEATAAAFARAAHVVQLEDLDPARRPACRWSRARRSATTTPRRGRYTLYAGNGGAGACEEDLADHARRSRGRRARGHRATSAAISARAA